MHHLSAKSNRLIQVLRCDEGIAKEVLHKFGACASPTTSARYVRKNVAAVKADQDEALRKLSDSWILTAAIDNGGKQQGSTFKNTVQIFLWAFPSTGSPEELPLGKEKPSAPPKISEKDEEEFERMNPISGDKAIEEELANIEGKVTTYDGGASAVVWRGPEAAKGCTRISFQYPTTH